MVIRDLTLRSAASFGSFHLIRLLYDEYMFYLVEHRVAQATGETPIAVMGEVREDIPDCSVENIFSNSLPFPESQFSDLSSMMPSLLDKGEPVDQGPTEQLHIYIVHSPCPASCLCYSSRLLL